MILEGSNLKKLKMRGGVMFQESSSESDEISTKSIISRARTRWRYLRTTLKENAFLFWDFKKCSTWRSSLRIIFSNSWIRTRSFSGWRLWSSVWSSLVVVATSFSILHTARVSRINFNWKRNSIYFFAYWFSNVVDFWKNESSFELHVKFSDFTRELSHLINVTVRTFHKKLTIR